MRARITSHHPWVKGAKTDIEIKEELLQSLKEEHGEVTIKAERFKDLQYDLGIEYEVVFEVKETMEIVRCTNCNKLLGKVEGSYEIKCPRCKTMNTDKESV